jgi:hypothetical protein
MVPGSFRLAAVLLAVLICSSITSASIKIYDATLNGAGENPMNGSTATGFGEVQLDDVLFQITVNENWTGLSNPATASHIHGPGAPGTNAPVLFPFAGVPSATGGSIPQQTFSISSSQIPQFDAGLMYMNVHTSTFPGGEIRGQLILTPEPGSVVLIAVAGAGFLMRRRRHS